MRCSDCGYEYPIKDLTVDKGTGKYLCPICYSKDRILRNIKIINVLLFTSGLIITIMGLYMLIGE